MINRSTLHSQFYSCFKEEITLLSAGSTIWN